MVNVLRKLPLFDSEADLLQEIINEYNQLASLCEDESRMPSFSQTQQRAKAANAEMLRGLARMYDPAATLLERAGLVKAFGKGLGDQAREAIRRSHTGPDLTLARRILN